VAPVSSAISPIFARPASDVQLSEADALRAGGVGDGILGAPCRHAINRVPASLSALAVSAMAELP